MLVSYRDCTAAVCPVVGRVELISRHEDQLTAITQLCKHEMRLLIGVKSGATVRHATHTHTHTFNGPLSETTQVSRYQKGKTNLDFTEARDSEWQWHPLGHMQVCTSLQSDNHASTPPLSFLQAGCPSCCPTNSVKALKARHATSLLTDFNTTETDFLHNVSSLICSLHQRSEARFTKYLTIILR